MGDIASGKTRTTAAQMRALTEINLRGFGRVTEKQQDTLPSAVVVLPVLGAEGNAQVCPNCLHVLADVKVEEHVEAMRRDVGQSEVK